MRHTADRRRLSIPACRLDFHLQELALRIEFEKDVFASLVDAQIDVGVAKLQWAHQRKQAPAYFSRQGGRSEFDIDVEAAIDRVADIELGDEEALTVMVTRTSRLPQAAPRLHLFRRETGKFRDWMLQCTISTCMLLLSSPRPGRLAVVPVGLAQEADSTSDGPS